jgi:hypothetical protein
MEDFRVDSFENKKQTDIGIMDRQGWALTACQIRWM